jgi:multiple sugar transport system permease protein
MQFNQKRWLKYLMISPLLLIIVLLSIFPLIHLSKLAFSDYNFTEGSEAYTGLANYHRMIQDQSFWNSIQRTLLFVSVSLVFEFVIGLGLALLVKDFIRLRSLIRTFLLAPMLMAPVGVGMVWKLNLRPEIGAVNIILRRVHLGRFAQAWIADPHWAMLAIIAVEIWQWTPFVFLFLLAGLEYIPKELYDAALVDGASIVQRFRYITLPLLIPTIITCLLLRTIDVFKAFDKIYILTAGGPAAITEIINLRLYNVCFKFLNYGYGAFLALISLIFISVFSGVYFILIRKIPK